MPVEKPLRLKASVDSSEHGQAKAGPREAWKILVTDDDGEVHSVTRMILAKLRLDGRPVTLFDAYSAAEAAEILEREPDIAILLLDVVMETDDAGLRLVRRIREDMGNKALRIILRTGQPGEAPEEKVIVDYDINDYKAKSELTAQKLFTTVISALRAYRDIVALERNRRGLEIILDSSDSLFRADSMRSFASGVLEQLSTFIGCRPNGILCVEGEVPKMAEASCDLKVVAACGEYTDCMGCALAQDCRHAEIVRLIKQAIDERGNIYGAEHTVVYLDGAGSKGIAALIHGDYRAGTEGRELLNVFASKISIGLANITHYEEMVVAKQRAEAALRAKSDLLATMSHELRTPLNAILGFGQVILADRQTALAESHRQSLTSIQTAGEHLLNLINGVLAYVEADDSLSPGDARPFRIEDALKACVGRQAAVAGRRSVTIAVAPDVAAVPPLNGNRRRFEAVIDQLLSNAVKFNRVGGRVIVSATRALDHISIAVSDTGSGISAASRERVFQPFVRLGEVMTADGGGCGIGLALARRLAEGMDGRLWAEANPEGGSIFRFEIPLGR